MALNGTLWRLNEEEKNKRLKLVMEIHNKVDDLNNCRIALLNCKAQANYLIGRIRYCKDHLPHDRAIFNPMRKEVWKSPNLWDPGKDFSLGAKAYAYLLYYRQQMNGVQKIIKNLKAELSYRNKDISKIQNELINLDEELDVKYRPVWKPCKFVLKNGVPKGDAISGERDTNPNLEGLKRFRYFDTMLQWMHFYDENDIEKFEDL